MSKAYHAQNIKMNMILCLGRAENHYFKEVEVSMNVITREHNGPSCIQQMVFGWKLIFLMSQCVPISFYCLAHRRPKYIWWNLLSFNLDLPDIDAYTPSVNIKVFSINITRTVECHTQYIERFIVTKLSFHNYDLSIYISSSNTILTRFIQFI